MEELGDDGEVGLSPAGPWASLWGLGKTKGGFEAHLDPFSNYSFKTVETLNLVQKTNDSLDIPLFFTPLVFTPCTWLIKSLPLPQPAFGQTETSSLAKNCHLDIISFLHQR